MTSALTNGTIFAVFSGKCGTIHRHEFEIDIQEMMAPQTASLGFGIVLDSTVFHDDNTGRDVHMYRCLLAEGLLPYTMISEKYVVKECMQAIRPGCIGRLAKMLRAAAAIAPKK